MPGGVRVESGTERAPLRRRARILLGDANMCTVRRCRSRQPLEGPVTTPRGNPLRSAGRSGGSHGEQFVPSLPPSHRGRVDPPATS